MATVQIVTDSAADIPDELARQLGIAIVPLTIRFGAEEFVDRQELSPQEFWAKCQSSSTLPETAAPSPGSFQAAFEAARDAGHDGVLALTLSSKLSATHQATVLGADAMAGQFPVRVVDSEAVTMAQGLIAIELAERAAAGATLEELETLAHQLVPRAGLIGTLDTLEHLIKGGRVTGAKAWLGSMLSIKPLLELRDGLVVEAGRQRTRSRALSTCVTKAEAVAPLRRVAVCHGDAADVDVVVSSLADLKTEVPLVVADMGSVVGTHGGPGTVGICWIRA